VAVAHSLFSGSGEHFARGLEEIELIIQPGAHEDSLAGIDFCDGQELNVTPTEMILWLRAGDAYADHIDYAVWLGSVLPLRMNVLRKSRKTPSHS
jgi:hypothetical protein